MVEKILDFLNDIKSDGKDFFIEAEAKPVIMTTFINEYNRTHAPSITVNSDGIIVLQDNAYVSVAPPDDIAHLFGRNRVYKTDYPYRLNNNKLIRELFDRGCRIGIN